MKKQKTSKPKAEGPAPKTKRGWKYWRSRLLLLLFSTVISLVAGELVLRWAMFSGGDGFAGFRDAGRYFYTWDEGYWRLVNKFDSTATPPREPHPKLGWTQYIDPGSFYHQDGPKVGRRRPVLLYGDSFSACIDSVQCFEDILNADTAFTRNHYLLNYGVGGYGVCQSSLLCRATAPHYQKPLVVFGMLTTDIERTVLPFRGGQKPYYDVEGDALQLKGYPIDPSTDHFLETHPLPTTSYLLRRYLNSPLNIVPYRIKTWFDEKEKSKDHIRAVNRLLIAQLARELRALDIEFVFLIFHFEDDMLSPDSEKNWYDEFLKEVMAENEIPYIWSKGIIRAHREAHPANNHSHYIVPGNGHPTTLYNRLIAAEIARTVYARQSLPVPPLDSLNANLYEARAWGYLQHLRSDSVAVQDIRKKAAANGIGVEEQFRRDTYFLMNQELGGEHPFEPDGVFEGKWRSGPAAVVK